MNSPFAPLRPFFALAWLAVAGCNQSALDPAIVAEHRTKLTLADEPDDAQTVLDVRNTMMGETEAVHDLDHEEGEPAGHEHEAGDAHHEHADHEHDEDKAHGDETKVDATADDPAKTDVAAEVAKEDEHADADHDHAKGEEHADHDHNHADHDHEHADHDHVDHDHAKKPVYEEMDVVMVGTVGGVPNPSKQSHPDFPFTKRQAVFFLSDPEAAAEYEEHAHQHAPGEECAFCSANAAEAAHMVAVVQFTDKAGKPLAVDVRDLFDLKEKETVVVRGKAKLAAGGMLTVDATGLYIRR